MPALGTMRIAMISEHAGEDAHVAELSAALAAAGHTVRLYTRGRPAADGVEVVRSPSSSLGEFASGMSEDWRTWRPDVAHAHFWTSGLAAISAARPRDVPVVQTFHTLGSVERRHRSPSAAGPALRVAYERQLGLVADRVIVRCRDELSELIRLGVPRGGTALVPAGVDVSRFQPRGPAAPREPRVPRILTVARPAEHQGIEDLIRALPWIPRAELVVAGGPPVTDLDADPYVGRLLGIAAECRVSGRVTLLGSVPAHEMPQWYRSADVLAAVPWYEQFGVTALEAMACGVPVVATAVGGLTDTVISGVTGDLVPSRDPRALGAALRRLLGDRLRRTSYGAAAADRAIHSYAWPRIAGRLTDVYETVTRPAVAEMLTRRSSTALDLVQ